ncbi:MAG: hypothetical protein NTNFB02_23920 [Nitrospira sp.]
MERLNEEARRAETTARASHRETVMKIGSIRGSSVPARIRLRQTGCRHNGDRLHGCGNTT